MEHDDNDGSDNECTLEEPLLPLHDEVLEAGGLDRGGEGENDDDRPSIHLVDGLPYNTSVLIKSLYFLDAL